METVPVLFLTVLVAGYFVLASCDIGLGMLMPYVARTPRERDRVVSAIAPYFLGTEVWLVGAVGVMAGLFPAWKSALFSGLWPVFAALLAGWVARDAGLWLRARGASAAWRGFWDAAVVVGSWTLAVTLGLAAGAVLTGAAPTGPLAFGTAATVVALFLLRGAAFGAERLVPAADGGRDGDAESADAAGRATRMIARAGLTVFALAFAASLIPGSLQPERVPLVAAAAAVPLIALAVTAGLSGPAVSRHTSALALAAVPLVAASGSALPLDSAPQGTLALVAFAMAPMIPLMIVGQVWLYRLLRRPAPESGFFVTAPVRPRTLTPHPAPEAAIHG